MEVQTTETVEAVLVEKGGSPPVPQAAPVADGFSGKPGDFQKDLAMLQASQTPQQTPQEQMPPNPEQTGTVEPAQPPQAEVTPVPDKFKNPDGSLNVEKVAKSTVDAEAALQKYLTMEKELRKTQNSVSTLSKGVPQPAHTEQQPPSSFAQQIEQDLKTAGAGEVLARLFEAARETAYNQAMGEIGEIRQETELTKRQRELESIAKDDPWVLSPDGFDALSKIRQARPWINGSQTPWTEAYRQHLADQVIASRQTGQVHNPTPKGLAAKAPPTPVNPAPRVSVQPAGPNLNQMSQDQITAHVKAMTPAQEKVFWASRGLKF